MKIDIKKDEENCVVSISVEVGAEELQEATKKEYLMLKKSVKIDGFRRGKVPEELLRSFFHQQVKEKIFKYFLAKLMKEEIKDIRIEGDIKIEEIDWEDDNSLKFRINTEFIPTILIEKEKYLNIPIKKESIEITEEEIQNALVELQDRYAEILPERDRRNLLENDICIMDIEVHIGDKKRTFKNQLIELGRNFFPKSFVEKVVGMVIGEERSFSIKLDEKLPEHPENQVNFKVKLNEIKKKRLPELNDNFARQVNGKISNLSTLKEMIQKELLRIKEEQKKKELSLKIIKYLLEKVAEFPLPKSMVERKFFSIYENYQRNKKIENIMKEEPKNIYVFLKKEENKEEEPTEEEIKRQIYEEAKRRVRIYLILDTIGNKENIYVEEEALNGLKINKIDKEILKEEMRMKKILDFLLEKNLK